MSTRLTPAATLHRLRHTRA